MIIIVIDEHEWPYRGISPPLYQCTIRATRTKTHVVCVEQNCGKSRGECIIDFVIFNNITIIPSTL